MSHGHHLGRVLLVSSPTGLVANTAPQTTVFTMVLPLEVIIGCGGLLALAVLYVTGRRSASEDGNGGGAGSDLDAASVDGSKAEDTPVKRVRGQRGRNRGRGRSATTAVGSEVGAELDADDSALVDDARSIEGFIAPVVEEDVTGPEIPAAVEEDVPVSEIPAAVEEEASDPVKAAETDPDTQPKVPAVVAKRSRWTRRKDISRVVDELLREARLKSASHTEEISETVVATPEDIAHEEAHEEAREDGARGGVDQAYGEADTDVSEGTTGQAEEIVTHVPVLVPELDADTKNRLLDFLDSPAGLDASVDLDDGMDEWATEITSDGTTESTLDGEAGTFDVSVEDHGALVEALETSIGEVDSDKDDTTEEAVPERESTIDVVDSTENEYYQENEGIFIEPTRARRARQRKKKPAATGADPNVAAASERKRLETEALAQARADEKLRRKENAQADREHRKLVKRARKQELAKRRAERGQSGPKVKTASSRSQRREEAKNTKEVLEQARAIESDFEIIRPEFILSGDTLELNGETGVLGPLILPTIPVRGSRWGSTARLTKRLNNLTAQNQTGITAAPAVVEATPEWQRAGLPEPIPARQR